MRTILDEIIATKRADVAAARAKVSLAKMRDRAAAAPAPRDFHHAITRPSPEGINLIAEIKRRSPSAGVIVRDFDPARIARTYESSGAAAISVLTDQRWFEGSGDHIAIVKAASELPVLRKDFLVDAYQVYESRALGADAVLLIVEAIGVEAVGTLLPIARALGMAVLVEVHSQTNLSALIDVVGMPGAIYLLGINNRNLAVQKTALATTERLSELLPSGTPFVAESGIHSYEDVRRVRSAGASAILVGEAILSAPDPTAKIDELLGRTAAE